MLIYFFGNNIFNETVAGKDGCARKRLNERRS